VRSVSFKHGLSLRNRAFRGLGGWSGKPLHPSLASVAIGATVAAVVFDVASIAWGMARIGRELYRAGTFVLMVGQVFLGLAVLTGWWDRRQLTRKRTEVRHVANAHAITMLAMAAASLSDIVVRRAAYPDAHHTPVAVLVLTLTVGMLALIGGTLGGELTFEFGLAVEPRPEGREQFQRSDPKAVDDHPSWGLTDAGDATGDHENAQRTAAIDAADIERLRGESDVDQRS
jgi:uncharacterized membrane protein